MFLSMLDGLHEELGLADKVALVRPAAGQLASVVKRISGLDEGIDVLDWTSE